MTAAKPLVWIVDNEWEDYKVEQDVLSQLGADIRITQSGEIPPDLLAQGHTVDALLVQVYVRVSKETLERLSKCRVISVFGGGVDRVDIDAASAKRIYVTYVPNYCVEEVSNHAMALLLACASRLPAHMVLARSGRWGAKAAAGPTRRLSNQSLGLLGFGRIARVIAHKAAAMGLRILAYDPFVDKALMESLAVTPANGLGELCTMSDYLCINAPLTPSTRGMLGKHQMSLMKSTAYIINISRGEIIDEDALIAFVREGRLAGAALDVVANEPPCPEREILRTDNIIVTPHIAYLSQESLQELKRRAAQAVVDVLEGRRPADPVNSGLF